MAGLVFVMHTRGPKHLPQVLTVLLLVVAALSTAWMILTVPVDERLVNSRVDIFLLAIPAAFAILTSNHESTRKQPLLLFFTAPFGFYVGLVIALSLVIGLTGVG